MMSGSRAWLLISLSAADRQYRGNTGYVDNVESIYRYDSSVPNHKQLAAGDFVMLRDSQGLLGIACIEHISTAPIDKVRQRCPVCRAVTIKLRKSAPTPWRCSKGHEFETPFVERNEITGYEAHYENSYLRTPGAVSARDLKAAAFRPNDQLSIEEIDLAKVERPLLIKHPEASILIERFLQNRVLASSDADSVVGALKNFGDPAGQFKSSMTDTRERVLRSIKIRRGQKKFRDKLVRRYGPRCLASGCDLMDIVEAAHIDPYRGESDNHPENGLLLRADLHTLFDLNLMAIDPAGLTLRFHPKITDKNYTVLEGKALQLPDNIAPAMEPLRKRWLEFICSIEKIVERSVVQAG